jgi:hypothetical protein
MERPALSRIQMNVAFQQQSALRTTGAQVSIQPALESRGSVHAARTEKCFPIRGKTVRRAVQ